MKKKLIVHGIAVAAVVATVICFIVQEMRFQQRVEEEHLHGFEAFDLIPAAAMIVVIAEIIFLRSLVVMLLKSRKNVVEIVFHCFFMIASAAFLALFFDILPQPDESNSIFAVVEKNFNQYGLWLFLGIIGIRMLFSIMWFFVVVPDYYAEPQLQ